MTIVELRYKKSTLEHEIKRLMDEFSKETGLGISRIDYSIISGPGQPSSYVVEAEAKI